MAKDIHRATRRHFSAENNIRIVLDGLRGAAPLFIFPAQDTNYSGMTKLNWPRRLQPLTILLLLTIYVSGGFGHAFSHSAVGHVDSGSSLQHTAGAIPFHDVVRREPTGAQASLRHDKTGDHPEDLSVIPSAPLLQASLHTAPGQRVSIRVRGGHQWHAHDPRAPPHRNG